VRTAVSSIVVLAVNGGGILVSAED